VWSSDGTEQGTSRVAGIGQSPNTSLFVLGSKLFALTGEMDPDTAASFTGLYSKGADEPGFSLVTTVPELQLAYGNLAVIGGRCVFRGSRLDSSGESSFPVMVNQLWSTDGTAAGTQEILTDSGFGFFAELTVFQDRVYFLASDANAGMELWRTDGTPAGTARFKDVNPGLADSYPDALTVVGNKLFFTAGTATNGNELWVSDGTAANTRLVTDLNPGSISGFPNSADPYGLTALGDRVFFFANGGKLYSSNGSAAGTVLIKDLTSAGSSGEGSGGFGAMAAYAGKLFFAADDGKNSVGYEPWVSDGTAAGTKLLKDINPGNEDGYSTGSLSYVAGAALNGMFLFAGDNGKTGT